MKNDWCSGIAPMRDSRFEGNATKKRDIFVGRKCSAAAFSEHGVCMTVFACEGAHVFDNAKNMKVALPSHRHGACCNALRANRRRRDHDHLGLGKHAGQPHLHIASARWKVDHDVVKIVRP